MLQVRPEPNCRAEQLELNWPIWYGTGVMEQFNVL